MPPLREAAWRPDLAAAIVAAPGVEPLLARLAQPGALVVTTGQQPGLFTGPMYTVHKALSARAVARVLESRWGRPVVPVYWVPGDDHDFSEVAGAAWLAADGSLVHAALPARAPEAPLTPMWREVLGPGVLPALDAFEASFLDAETRDPVVGWLRRHYVPEATVSGAFGRALAELLAPLGVLCLDSTHAAVKRAEAPWLIAALRDAAPIDRELAQRSAQLTAGGQSPGVPVGEGASLVFLDTPAGRDRLVISERGFLARRSRLSLSLTQLEAIAAEEPTRLSGNVLLRPVLESAILPTVAYMAGPGELRYLALTAPVYQRLGVAAQAPMPRWSGYLLEARVLRVLTKFGATVEDLLAEGGALERRLAREALPEGTDAALASLRTAIEAGYQPVLRAATAVDPTLTRPAESARGRALAGVTRLEAKLLQHARRRERVELDQITRARQSIRPGGKPQERVLTLAGFLARYGPYLLEDLARHTAAWYAAALEAARLTT